MIIADDSKVNWSSSINHLHRGGVLPIVIGQAPILLVYLFILVLVLCGSYLGYICRGPSHSIVLTFGMNDMLAHNISIFCIEYINLLYFYLALYEIVEF